MAEYGKRAYQVGQRTQHEHVFLNRCGRPITRFAIHTMVERYVKRVSAKLPALATKRVSPHSLRHTTATHLLRAGVDINTIRAWLGHVSIDTSNIYAETDLEMKAKALATCEVKETKRSRRWKEDKGLNDVPARALSLELMWRLVRWFLLRVG